MHDAIERCRRRLAELEGLRAEFKGIVDRHDPERRHDLIALRRRFMAAIADAETACEPLFADAATAPLRRGYRDRFSRWRSAVAEHQATWPAVSIDEDPVAYAASARPSRDLEQAFLAWMRRVCTAIEGKGDLPPPDR